jgi:hypothetical protein
VWKLKAVSLYHPGINDGAAAGTSTFCLRAFPKNIGEWEGDTGRGEAQKATLQPQLAMRAKPDEPEHLRVWFFIEQDRIRL